MVGRVTNVGIGVPREVRFVRIPPEFAEAAGLRAGDAMDIEVMPTGEIHLTPVMKTSFDKASFLAELEVLHAKMPMTEPVVERMRDEARY